MNVRTLGFAVLTAGSLAISACGGSSSPTLEVGACTTADPTQSLSFDVKAVDCDEKDAKSKIVREVKDSKECDVASVSDSKNDKVFCTEPYPPGSAPARPAVGACMTADPKQIVSVNVRLVNCDDPQAKSRIVKRAASERECDEGSIKGARGEVFCIEST